ncbi:HAT family dimerization domain-containing protein [Canna indica]|uniref:HAT family dimerization domain-containing protein n=1 Tax=Canna indica TaxID=4628 RepID=A0AAQ3KIM6_9LILI|nr:HAT family dimerization domain-containing protein [Canna indica]
MLAYCTKRDASTTKMLVPHSYKFEDCRRALAEFVICDEQAFMVVEGDRSFENHKGDTTPKDVEKCLMECGT